MNLPAPFFILGNPRSGTTLLRLMLDAHPDVTVPPECGFMIWFYPKYNSWNAQDCTKETVELFVADLKTAKKIDSWDLNFDKLEEHLLNVAPASYAHLVDEVYSFFASQHHTSRQLWGDKNNFYLNHIKEIIEIFNQARFIHIIRDGRDVACSYKELNNKKIHSDFAPKLTNSIKEIAKEWQENNVLILNDLEQCVRKDRFISVRFEDLVLSPSDELRKVSQFLDIDYHPNMLAYYTYSKTYEPDEYLQWKSHTKKAPQTSRIKRYLSDLTTTEIAEFNHQANGLLTRFQYEC